MFVAAFVFSQALLNPVQGEPKPKAPRFASGGVLAGLPQVMLDQEQASRFESDRLALSKRVQGRVIWIDATANLDRTNSKEKIVKWVQTLFECGFNTVVLDVKPISGHVIYPSKLAPKIAEWRGRILPEEFDPVPVFVEECKRKKLSLLASFNAFSEGHSLFKTGPGYGNESWQTQVYEPVYSVKFAGGEIPLHRRNNRSADHGVLAHVNNSGLISDATRFCVTVDADGIIVDGFENPTAKSVTVPNGGFALLADSSTVDRLKELAIPGTSVQLIASSRIMPISQMQNPQIPLITNPASPEVVQRNLDLLKEFLSAYNVDGIVYDDRFRFAGMNADFSPEMLDLFAKWLGIQAIEPAQIFSYTINNQFETGIEPGPQYQNWLVFRGLLMKRYLQLVRKNILSIKPSVRLGLYAGSWYGEYASFGTNVGSPFLEAGFWHHTTEFAQTGLADEIDLLMTGCYYRVPTIFEALKRGLGIGATIESAARLSTAVAQDQTWTYAGISLDQYKGNPRGLQNALQAAASSSQGVMVFDLSHDFEPMIPVFQQAFRNPMPPPHSDPKLLVELRRRAALVKKRRPVVVSVGQPGAGH